MTLKKAHVVEYIALINLQFPNAYQFTSERDRELFISLWYDGLKTYPKEVCDEAVKNVLFKADFAPKIATIKKEIDGMTASQDASDFELWNEFFYALNSISNEVPFTSSAYDTVVHDDTGKTTAGEAWEFIKQVYNSLHPKIKEYCGSVRGFMEIARQDEEALRFEKARFIRQLPLLSERIRIKAQMPPQLAGIIKGISDSNKRNLLEDKR